MDHFDPRKKNDLIQEYENLFPASRQCNQKKSNLWPTAKEAAAGCRFLNPCEEMDYGEQVFEDPLTGQLVGTTVAARWHILICGLNSQRFINERFRRAGYWNQIKRNPIRVKRRSADLVELIQSFRNEVALMIPEIPAPPAQSPAAAAGNKKIPVG